MRPADHTLRPEVRQRQSIRLPGYDYSQAGSYFVTICTQGQEMLLEPAQVQNMARSVWEALPQRFPGVHLNAFVVMPDHVHSIIVIKDPRRGEPGVRPDGGVDAVGRADTRSVPTFRGAYPGPASLGRIVQVFKSRTTAVYAAGVKSQGWKPFPGRLWQRNYYEHIIRTEDELNRVREYIESNPTHWELDRDNPLACREEGHWR